MANRSLDREQFLADIVICFAEDFGTNPWRTIAKYKCQCKPADTFVRFVEEEDEDKPEFDVNIDTVATGLNKIILGEVGIREDMKKNITGASKENDAGDIDAYDADMIVQAAVFGELRYG